MVAVMKRQMEEVAAPVACNDRSPGAKGKRTKRQRPHSLSPSFSVAVDSPTTAEEDAARCLTLLSRGHFLVFSRRSKPSEAIGRATRSRKTTRNQGRYKTPTTTDFPSSKKKIPPSLSLHTAAGDGGGRRISSPRVHECSYCGTEFASGPALGGQMRRHRAGTTSPLPEPKRQRNGLALDLNFPAPEDESQRFKYELKYEEVQLFLTH